MTQAHTQGERCAPASSTNPLGSHRLRPCRYPTHWFSRLVELVEKVQVSNRGQYSLERLQAFDEFCQRTTVMRAICVCICTPLPVLAVVLLAESLPLTSPREGPARNLWFWIRFQLLVCVIVFSNLVQAKTWVPEIPLTKVKMAVFTLGVSTVLVSFNVNLATRWVFPIPFMVLLDTPLLFVMLFIGIRSIARSDALQRNTDAQMRFQEYLALFTAQTSLLLVYPAYNGVFLVLPSQLQMPFVALLALIRIAMRNAIAAFGPQLEDCLPETIVFSVEVFNTLYLVACMQSVYSFWVVALIMGFDTLYNALAVRSLAIKYPAVKQFHKSQAQQRDDRVRGSNSNALFAHVLELVLQMKETPAERVEPHSFRLRAKVPHQLSWCNAELLQALCRARELSDCVQSTDSSAAVATAATAATAKSLRALVKCASNAVRPDIVHLGTDLYSHSDGSAANAALSFVPLRVPTNKVVPTSPRSTLCTPAAHEPSNTVFVTQTLRLLFHCEYLILAEYVEWVIPFAYAIYLPILKQLSSAVYFPSMRDIDSDELLHFATTVLALATLEVVSFAALHYIVTNMFGISPLYQVAFVLETQVVLVQAKLIVWVLFALEFNVDHYGADFTFEFAWTR